jgi:hypothetical protein
MGERKVFQSSRILYSAICLFLLGVFGNAWGEEPNEPNPGPFAAGFERTRLSLGFDQNDYNFLVYNAGGIQNRIEDAMEELGIIHFTVRTPENAVSLNDLATHDILIVGWALYGSLAGLDREVLVSGIDGRVVLSGHDADYHTAAGTPKDTTGFEPADIFFAQSIEYILAGSGTGLLVWADSSLSPMRWLPSEWGIVSANVSKEKSTSFTPSGSASGIFDGLTPNDMSDWNQSYHNIFTAWGGGFKAFELGEKNESEFGYDIVTIGARKSPLTFDLRKVDDVNELSECVSPEDGEPDVTYTISMASKYRDHTNIFIVDHLPKEADFYRAVPDTGTYDLLTHTYTWYLDELAGYDPNDPNGPSDPNTYFTLTVRVSDRSEPLNWMVNEVIVESDQWDGYTRERTPICCWGGEVIYVDCHAPGTVQNGTCWAYAYRDLQRALMRAERGCGSIIKVADGVYGPGDSSGDTFKIPEGVFVYGGYAGYGAADPDTRDWKKYRTILSGYVDESTRNNTVVTMGDNSLLDGVIVEEGVRGIYGDNADFQVVKCIIRENEERGIHCEGGNTSICWSKIYSNGYQGVYHTGRNYLLSLEHCNLYDNHRDGILTEYSTSTVINSLIYQNGSGSAYFDKYYGINLVNPGANTVIRNNTIVYNTNEGIRRVGGSVPDVRNCILFANNADDNYIDYNDYGITWNCCLTDPNNMNQPMADPPTDGRGNIKTHPGFAYPYPEYGYFHLNWDSPCRDKGDSGNYPNEKDMDGQDRVYGIKVDIGADEITCEDTSDPNDWNGDGVINYEEFAILSHAWLSCDPNSPSYHNPNNPDPNDVNAWYIKKVGPLADMNKDSCVDIADLIEFCDSNNWLWEACWRQDYWQTWGMKDGGGERESVLALSGAEAMAAVPMMATYQQTTSEPAPKTMIQNIQQILAEIEKQMEEEPENYEGLNELKVFLGGVLWELKISEN